jgi:tricorn protease
LADDKPASLSSDGEATSYDFSVKQTFGIAARYEAIFDLCWRAMRDFFYDAQLNNRNWDDVRRKYRRVAHAAVDDQTLVEVVQMMLGELNASHLGFGMFDRPPRPRLNDWRPVTAHLGVRFDASYRGPGLRIRDVLPDGPADRVTSQLAVGELVLSIDGHNVDPGRDLTEILNGPVDRDIHLRVRDVNGEDRDVTLRPISYAQARALLYEKWIDHNQQLVAKASEDKLGYLHIRGMDMGSFYRFEHELYSAAAGKDGIVIDVRDNGGGFTTDHLLTVLTQPTHAITVPRGGDPGYPQDRTVYATWRKPIVVLCNQNSFSNAEIFSHAIKTLNRGKLVGVRTAGGVISTGSVNIMNVGFLRRPFRGWFVSGTGQDMELNGAIPDYEIWPQPEELPTGIDRQLDKAIEVLKDQVMQWQAKPRPALQKNSQRP